MITLSITVHYSAEFNSYDSRLTCMCMRSKYARFPQCGHQSIKEAKEVAVRTS